MNKNWHNYQEELTNQQRWSFDNSILIEQNSHKEAHQLWPLFTGGRFLSKVESLKFLPCLWRNNDKNVLTDLRKSWAQLHYNQECELENARSLLRNKYPNPRPQDDWVENVLFPCEVEPWATENVNIFFQDR